MELKILNKNISIKKYVCSLTEELDNLSGLSGEGCNNIFRHYILYDKISKKIKYLPIRVPGGTVGGITLDENNVITDIAIDTDYVIATYPDNINELVKRFVGERMVFRM